MTIHAARTLITATAAALLTAGTLAGCGSDRPSTTEYRSAVNAICTVGNERIGKLMSESPLGPDSTEKQQLEVLDQLLADINSQIDDIDALEAPSDLGADVDAWLTDARKTIDNVRSGGTEFFAQQASGTNPFAAPNAKAIQLGFKACGE